MVKDATADRSDDEMHAADADRFERVTVEDEE